MLKILIRSQLAICALASNLERLEGAEGRADVMDLALSVGSVEQARFVVETVIMLRQYHEKVAELASVEVAGTLIGRTGDRIVVVAPADYVSYSEPLAQFAERDEFSDETVEFLIAGQATEQAVQKLAEKGWKVRTNSVLLDR